MRAITDVVGAAVLLASGRSLPPLEKILAAHPLIHTAEGEFFRHTVSQACEDLQISVTAIRQRDLDERAKAAFGKAAQPSPGPYRKPWKDNRTALDQGPQNGSTGRGTAPETRVKFPKSP